jgi:hypothetical protein
LYLVWQNADQEDPCNARTLSRLQKKLTQKEARMASEQFLNTHVF